MYRPEVNLSESDGIYIDLCIQCVMHAVIVWRRSVITKIVLNASCFKNSHRMFYFEGYVWYLPISVL